MAKLVNFFKQDRLFLISFILALVSCLLGSFDVGAIDFKTIAVLFGLMLLIAGLENSGLLHFIAVKFIKHSKTTRDLSRYLILLSFFGSMILTNDVAIFTLLPIYFKIIKQLPKFKNHLLTAVLIIMGANLGSSFLPFGNPHNLFLFGYYNIGIAEFFSWTTTLAVIGLVIIMATCQLVAAEPLDDEEYHITGEKLNVVHTVIFLALILLVTATIFNLVAYYYAIPVIAIVCLILRPKIYTTVDYHLLFTFICFFLIVGNISDWTWLTDTISKFLQHPNIAFIGSVAISQVISNVPASILVAPFSNQAQAVLIGTNIGGIGTLIGSLANLIGYKVVKMYAPKEIHAFFKVFTIVNFAILAVLVVVFLVII